MRKLLMSKILTPEIWNPCDWPTKIDNNTYSSSSISPYTKISEDDLVYDGEEYEHNYFEEICYWSSVKGRCSGGEYLQNVYYKGLFKTRPFPKHELFYKFQEKYNNYGQLNVLDDIPRIPHLEAVFYNFFKKYTGLFVLYFESSLYDHYKDKNLKRDIGLYFHSESYIQKCLSYYQFNLLEQYKHRTRNYNTRPTDHFHSHYYIIDI